MNKGRKVSVLMGVYNCEKTLEEAVRSIQMQTYTNWELILCEDGSTDGTFAVAERLAMEDPRIFLMRNRKNCGLNKTLNRCLQKATGEYIARMDGDDTCDPIRFEKQVTFLEQSSSYDLVSTAMTFFDKNGTWGKNQVIRCPEKSDLIKGSPICHAPVMMRKKCMEEVGGYTEDKRMLRVEDVNLWIKLYAKGYRCFNIQEPLYHMRNDKNAVNRRRYRYRINETYVRLMGCRQLHMAPIYYLYALKPLAAGAVPAKLRFFIRRRQWKND